MTWETSGAFQGSKMTLFIGREPFEGKIQLKILF